MRSPTEYVEQAKESLYFSGAKIDELVATFLRDHADRCVELGERLAGGTSQIYFVGSGGSLAAMQVAKYALDSILGAPVDAVPSYELVWRGPTRLDRDAVVFCTSYSGETEDTLAALRYAQARGARTIGIVGRDGSTMGLEADETISYGSGAIFEVPVLALILMAAGFAKKTHRAPDVEQLRIALYDLPEILRGTLEAEASRAEQRARDLLHVQHLYVLGAGPLSPLAYKFAMNVVMENVRIGATYSDAVEWRHGPAEALERLRATVVVLLGTDASRALSERAIDFCRSQRSEVVVYDALEFGDIDPCLVPIVMNSHLQWLVVYSAILRGITDLDERVFMGREVLSAGGAQWP